ncbi:MAG: hypothetical protein KKH29_04000 [Candidatus Omnitrophica bacterium]|nr:hypothetical protein [Candidatus Omnitrophota bacterium]MBU4472638.1 hypothetical protein [Candidatus Omnitrophota bacterium]MCG2706739.1 hypothetical protein [Candidatus Omnitrophota bacterium]
MKRQADNVIILLLAVLISMVKIGEALSESTAEVLEPRHIEYRAGDLRDPFESLKKEEPIEEPALAPTPAPKEQIIKAVQLPDLVIQGVIWGGRLPQAIINNKVVKIGDTIETVEIIDINKEGIIISFENKEYNLSSLAADSVLTGYSRSAEVQEDTDRNLIDFEKSRNAGLNHWLSSAPSPPVSHKE